MEESRYSGVPHHILMKGSAVGRLNAPWRKVLHLARRKIIRKGQSVDIRTSLSGPDGRSCFYYVVSGKIRLSYVSRNGEERTILYAGPDTLMNVPSVLVGDEDNTLVTCTEDAEVALFDAALLSDEAFAAQYPDLMINLVHSLCVHMVIHSQRLAESSLSNSVAQVCRRYGVPFLSLRVISDIHVSESEQRLSYEGFWNDISDNSFSVLARLLEAI